MPDHTPFMHTLRWAFALLCIAVAALIGSQWGAYRERSKVQEQLTEYQQQLASINDTHQAELIELRTQRDVADASNAALQESLKEMQAQSLEQKSQKRLYDRIEGTDIGTGLNIDTIIKVNNSDGETAELHITIVQARGRDRVKGQMGVALLGEKNDGNWREVIVDVNSDEAPRFDLRFFQTLVVPVPENDILIDIVEIDVVPDGKRHKPFSYEMDWASIQED